MKDKFFLDTNIFVYSLDKKSKKKQKEAQELIALALEKHCGIISTQVIQEFLNVATRKFTKPLNISDCRTYLETILTPLCEIFPSIAFYRQALSIQEETRYSFYDSLIITAAVEGNCKILYSEDLQDEEAIRGVKIQNPFC